MLRSPLPPCSLHSPLPPCSGEARKPVTEHCSLNLPRSCRMSSVRGFTRQREFIASRWIIHFQTVSASSLHPHLWSVGVEGHAPVCVGISLRSGVLDQPEPTLRPMRQAMGATCPLLPWVCD